MSTFQDKVRAVVDDLSNLMVERQRKYGPKNIEAGGILGCLIRAQDKIERLKVAYPCLHPVIKAQQEFEDESIEDAMMDLANYGIIALMLYRGTWGKPLADPLEALLVTPSTKAAVLPPRDN